MPRRMKGKSNGAWRDRNTYSGRGGPGRTNPATPRMDKRMLRLGLRIRSANAAGLAIVRRGDVVPRPPAADPTLPTLRELGGYAAAAVVLATIIMLLASCTAFHYEALSPDGQVIKTVNGITFLTERAFEGLDAQLGDERSISIKRYGSGPDADVIQAIVAGAVDAALRRLLPVPGAPL